MSILDDVKELVVDSYERRGVKVYVKTDIGPEIKVFDSDAPVNKDGSDTSSDSQLIKYGVIVRDRKGKRIGSYGKYPDTNPIKLLIIAGVVGTGLFITLKGIKASIL